jgi:hypothetical protein
MIFPAVVPCTNTGVNLVRLVGNSAQDRCLFNLVSKDTSVCVIPLMVTVVVPSQTIDVVDGRAARYRLHALAVLLLSRM